ncbi:DUF1553 domain-containing protein [Nibrella viscosa]|uniref:DUF1553 domain-containing protein n=1 Tax=Nibrella viscosa TaxID=1084524 RepID=A0ABP8KQG4_9BACT
MATVIGLSCRHVDKPAEILAAEKSLPEKVDYNLHIKPILSDRCFACHGPDKNKQQAGLRLDTPESAYAALKESGNTAIVPGSLRKSELYHRITSTDPEYMMPTPESNLALSAEEKALIVRWIEQGAEYKPHWSLIAPTKVALPQVNNRRWVRNAIDNFVLKKLEEKGLTPAAEADKTTLLRRLSLDLTGLPPTPAEVDAFLADSSPNAYEKVVDRLLASPHYGERQAVEWLDAARYADTHGYQLDVMRTAWPYRDWVIKAYNQNLPFDKFITWQLAGDLLPVAGSREIARDRLVATAFNRMHPQNQEGGIVEEEYLTEYAADRTNTFGKAMLGMTVECARCHAHKYDPISQKDYYQLFAFFNTINEAGQVPYNGESTPTLLLTTEDAEAKLRFIREKLTALEPALNPANPAYTNGFQNWLSTIRRQPAQLIDRPGLAGRYRFEDTDPKTFCNEADPFNTARLSGDTDRIPEIVPGRWGNARKVNGEGHIDLGKQIAFYDRHQPFSVSLWVYLLKDGLRGPVFSRSNGLDNGNRGIECLMQKDGTLSINLNHSHPDNAIDLRTVQKFPVRQWTHLTITYDGSGSAKGTNLYLNGRLVPVRVFADNLKKSMLYGPGHTNGFGLFENFRLGGKFRDSMADFLVDELEIYCRAITPLEIAGLYQQKDLAREWLKQPSITAGQQNLLRAYYVSAVNPQYAKAAQEAAAWRAQETSVYDGCDEVMIMKERRYARKTHLLKRGVYDAPGEPVQPDTPAEFGPMPSNLPRNRLGLAQWLLRPDNPLFSRVMVNRFWQQYFGQGLVKSSDDFGNQGNLPTHPELLDYLAVHFRESGWNVKALQKLIVLSTTYRQSSVADARKREADPDNSLLSHGPSYRLSAEIIRDGALAASGLLVRKIGGPSVYPYQPFGVWESLSTLKYRQQHGDSLYRRSMYTIWKRTAPHPAMLTFDAPERHFCTVKRQKTSTPLQALITLNDPQFVEAARVLAQGAWGVGNGAWGQKQGAGRLGSSSLRQGTDYKSMGRSDESVEGVVQYMVKSIVSRPARPKELELMAQLYASELADFRKNPKQAAELLAVGEYPVDKRIPPPELAAWTVVASTLLNFDEVIVKR